MANKKTVIVTGASEGIGAAVVQVRITEDCSAKEVAHRLKIS